MKKTILYYHTIFNTKCQYFFGKQSNDLTMYAFMLEKTVEMTYNRNNKIVKTER